MNKPKMIIFDYGQTLANERRFDGVAGTRAILEHAVSNRYGRTAEQVQAEADRINNMLGRFDPERRHLCEIEVPTQMFGAYLYASQGIELDLSPLEYDRIFWNAAAPGVPTEGIADFLGLLRTMGIRTGVISNISYCTEAVTERINTLLPDNDFEFIITSSEYMFRKPRREIFELALEKAQLAPDEVWYIGDQYRADVTGARSAGIFPVWYLGAIDMPYEEKDDVLTVRSWDELAEILKGAQQ